MAVDTPATIAILGAGPIGLEAALYARFLGYDVRVFDQGEVAENVRRWGHVRMFTPFAMNASPLGLAALAAQDEDFRAPPEDALLSGLEWLEQYLRPLAQSDLLADHVYLHTRVLAVSRWGATKGEWVGDERRTDTDFRVLLVDQAGQERTETAEVVLDTTGTFGTANWLGPGGAPAVGERQLRSAIEYGLPDVLGRDRAHYTGRHTLLVGSGYSAATTLTALQQLADVATTTRITWLTFGGDSEAGPLSRIADDRLPERDALARRANELSLAGSPALEHFAGQTITSVARKGEGFQVELLDIEAEQQRTLDCDRIVANVGYRGDWSLSSELQLHQCYATEGPMKLAAALLGQNKADCLEVRPGDAPALLNPEPNYYVLGAKSYGRNSQFLFATGLQQIRDLFTIIGERADLDLYAGARSLPR